MSQSHIAQPHRYQGREGSGGSEVVVEELHGLLDRHLQDIVDIFAPIQHLQDLCLEARAAAQGAGDVDIGKKLHLDLFKPLPLTFLAPPPGDVEGEGPWGISPRLGEGLSREEAPDGVIGLEIGEGVGPGGLSNRSLVHQDHLGDQLRPPDLSKSPRSLLMTPLGPLEPLIYDVLCQGALARAGDPGDTGHQPQGDLQVDLLQVVFRRPPDLDDLPLLRPSALLGYRDTQGPL